MKEILVILVVIGIFFALLAYRYRRQITMAIQIWRTLKKMRQMSGTETSDEQLSANKQDVQLVRCAKCGNWKPQNQSLKFSRGTFYCSSKCVNEALNVR
jgi:hypothetical protein